jgi:paraquat-inducible protein B
VGCGSGDTPLSNSDPAGPLPDAPPSPELSPWVGLPGVWAVPVVALLIAGWLGYRALIEHGPTITITFATADGIETGRTTIRYKNVELGQVTGIDLTSDSPHVVVTATMRPKAERMLRADTKFWLVQPRITPSGISGLTTIVSGAYIDMLPGKGPPCARSFTALETPPPKEGLVDGRDFTLVSDRLPSITNQSPVYYHGFQVGEIAGYELSDRDGSVAIRIFVYAPHESLIRPASRFWASSGLQLEVSGQGLKIGTESLLTLIDGGIVFDTPKSALNALPSPPGSTFQLYGDRQDAEEAGRVRVSYRLFFSGSLRGIGVGTPVELRGITVGHVSQVILEYDPSSDALGVPVTIEIEPDRVAVPSKATRENPSEETNRIFERLVAEGLRAQIVAGNLLLGQRVIALDFVPGAPPARLVQANPYPELPTVPGTDIQDIATSTGKLVEAFATLPLDRLISEIHGMVSHADNLLASPEVKHALQELDRTLGNTRRLTHDAQVQTGPLLASFKSASDQLQATVAILGRDPSSSNDMLQTLTELKNAARSVRVLADYLERHPESLLRGKPQDTAR